MSNRKPKADSDTYHNWKETYLGPLIWWDGFPGGWVGCNSCGWKIKMRGGGGWNRCNAKFEHHVLVDHGIEMPGQMKDVA